MSNYPRRGSRLPLECSCEGRVTEWALTPWGDRLYAVQLLDKGERCRIARHEPGRKLSVRIRIGTRKTVDHDTRRG